LSSSHAPHGADDARGVNGINGDRTRYGRPGIALAIMPLTTASLAGVPAADSGAASGLVNMLQLVGGALGLGVLVAVYGTASGHGVSPHAVTHGIGAAFGFAALLDVCSLLVIIALIRTRRLGPAPAPAPRQQEEAIAS